MSDTLWVLVGLATLLIGAESLVRGAVWIALQAGIDKLVVGLTLVAFGTSAPEVSAALVAALDGSPGFATGTVLGSNIANIGLIVGLTSMYRAIPHASGTARFEVRYLMMMTLLFIASVAFGGITRTLGAILLGLLILFTIILVERARRMRRDRRAARAAGDDSDPGPDPASLGRWLVHVTMVAIGLLGLKFGGEWLVNGSRGLAQSWGMSEQTAGQLIVGAGTSLPELATCLVAAYRRHPEIALGNVLGSNVFNVGMVLGITGSIRPLPLTLEGDGLALVVMGIMTIALTVLLRFRDGVSRGFGLMFFAAYAGYVGWLIAGNG